MFKLIQFSRCVYRNWRKIGKTLLLQLLKCVICYLVILFMVLFISGIFKPQPYNLEVDPIFRLTQKAAEAYLINQQWKEKICQTSDHEKLCKLAHERLPQLSDDYVMQITQKQNRRKIRVCWLYQNETEEVCESPLRENEQIVAMPTRIDEIVQIRLEVTLKVSEMEDHVVSEEMEEMDDFTCEFVKKEGRIKRFVRQYYHIFCILLGNGLALFFTLGYAVVQMSKIWKQIKKDV